MGLVIGGVLAGSAALALNTPSADVPATPASITAASMFTAPLASDMATRTVITTGTVSDDTRETRDATKPKHASKKANHVRMQTQQATQQQAPHHTADTAANHHPTSGGTVPAPSGSHDTHMGDQGSGACD